VRSQLPSGSPSARLRRASLPRNAGCTSSSSANTRTCAAPRAPEEEPMRSRASDLRPARLRPAHIRPELRSLVANNARQCRLPRALHRTSALPSLARVDRNAGRRPHCGKRDLDPRVPWVSPFIARGRCRPTDDARRPSRPYGLSEQNHYSDQRKARPRKQRQRRSS
jgi:hypothetical protein